MPCVRPPASGGWLAQRTVFVTVFVAPALLVAVAVIVTVVP